MRQPSSNEINSSESNERSPVSANSRGIGPAFGGIRLGDYQTPAVALADAMRLAEHMTLKCAIQAVPGGGGKVALMRQPGMDRGAVYRRVGDHVAALGGRYFTGPDVGTDPEDLSSVAERTIFVALPDAPDALPGVDIDKAASASNRAKLLDQAESEDWIGAAGHFPPGQQIGKVVTEGGKRRWKPL